MTAREVKHLLQLQPHPREGGWYVRTWESSDWITVDDRYDGPRRTSTAIYYLLEGGADEKLDRFMLQVRVSPDIREG